MASIELVSNPVDGSGNDGHFHAAELDNIYRALGHHGVGAHTYSATVTGGNMIVTLPAMTVYCPDGSGGTTTVNYAGGDITIAASHATLPRTSHIEILANNTAAEVQGTPTAETGDVEEAPMGALSATAVMACKVRVDAAVTVIGTGKVWGRAIDVSEARPGIIWELVGSDTTERTMTSATAADLATVSGLTIPATTSVWVVVRYGKSAATHTPALGLKVNSTVVREAIYGTSGIRVMGATNEVQSGTLSFLLGPRRTNYDYGITGTYHEGGASAAVAGVLPETVLQTAAIPVATITDIIIRGDSDGTNTLRIHGVYVCTLAV